MRKLQARSLHFRDPFLCAKQPHAYGAIFTVITRGAGGTFTFCRGLQKLRAVRQAKSATHVKYVANSIEPRRHVDYTSYTHSLEIPRHGARRASKPNQSEHYARRGYAKRGGAAAAVENLTTMRNQLTCITTYQRFFFCFKKRLTTFKMNTCANASVRNQITKLTVGLGSMGDLPSVAPGPIAGQV